MTHFASIDKVGEAIALGYSDSVEVKALHEVGLEPEFVTMFVSNSIQDLVLTRANEVPARDKIANTTAGGDLIALLDAIDKTVSDPERGHTWIPSVAKAGCAALRVLCDVENTSLDAVSDVCKVFGPENPRLAEMTPKGDFGIRLDRQCQSWTPVGGAC